MKVMILVAALLGGVVHAGCEPRVQHVAPAPVAPVAEWEARRAVLKARWRVEDAAEAAELDARWVRLEAARAEAWAAAPSKGGKDQ